MNHGKSKRIISRRAITLVEVLVAVVIISLLGLTMMTGIRALVIGADRQNTESNMGMDARASIDEYLYQSRYASSVVTSYTAATRTFTTGNSSVVFQAAGYDPSTAGIVLPGVTDYLIFSYDATNRQFLETIVPGAGSKRPSRANYRLARNVQAVTYTYRTRDQFTSTVAGPAIYTLSTNAIAVPLVYVDGVAASCTWSAATPQKISVNTATVGSSILVLYSVSPTDNAGAALSYVKQVDVTLDLASNDSRSYTRTLTMTGTACLRNQRL